MAQNAQNCSIQREMQKQPKNFKKCQVGEAASIWPLKASKLEIYARFYLTKLVSKYIHDRIIYKKKWCHSTISTAIHFNKIFSIFLSSNILNFKDMMK